MNKKLEAKSKDAAMLNAMINVNNPNYRIQYVQNPVNHTNTEQKYMMPAYKHTQSAYSTGADKYKSCMWLLK
jgi:hypothetical protein